MPRDTAVDFEDHLDIVDDKMQSVFSGAAEGSGGDAIQVQQTQEERLSTQQCIDVFAQLSAHISQMQTVLTATCNRRSADRHDTRIAATFDLRALTAANTPLARD